ncbi:MAG TPA: cation diffusion facilitator family transporter [Paenalcaligenes hominis]|uniref:Cation diffusion facilitator family transporter n=1 Tax=Paenalcaligenes hominis TaxID=643674 RepID=A0A1U9K1K5_9BURK|nr:cation diffusion facilitator family transporter [Paenalcaligenes hominis]AQS51906.1 cation-efflux pump [Paenalcaligenes hominis]NJB64853.1 cation diffusion facilitator family transporter [Paenalcaligenes hominis]GGE58483.1 cobalt transporter [Paenalcaligenes hominis]HJH23575.1 cation diffusion facilitator family transporter [Paenalcaligenes hominis]
MPRTDDNELERNLAAARSTLVSVAVNLFLSILQLIVGIFAKSQALIADSIHSLSDLISDAIVLIANKHSSKAPDAEHPYGHHRFETAATLAVGAILIIVGLGMLWSSFTKLQNPGLIQTVHLLALPIAVLALIAKELLFRYLLRVAKRVRSTMLVANAWHARSDAASSLVVAVAIVANLMGLPIADPIAVLVVGLLILRMGWRFAFNAFNDLMDQAVDDATEAKITKIILETPGVMGLHDLKTRKLGDMIWVEVDLEMDGRLTIYEGHEIAEDARRRVMAVLPALDVMTHFDPVDVVNPE